MTATLHIRLLGEFSLASGEIPLTGVDWPRLQSLLAYLVLHHNAPQSRTHLASLLWPDSTETQAHSNLRTLLFRLRQALPHSTSFLRIEKQTLRWQPQYTGVSWTLDVLDFERAVAQVQQVKNAPTARTLLEQAVALYHGDLLPGCYDEWILPERERLRQTFLEVLERLVGVLEQERDTPAAIRAAQRLLRHDPLHEVTYRHLMHLYAGDGDRAAALRVYHTCTTVLERELGTGPSRATRQMYEHLLQAETPAGSSVTSLPPLVAETALIGRRHEWANLLATWQRATTGQPHLVVLSGEAGIGKTRLAEELVIWLGRQGIPTATAHCYPAEGELAYAPVAMWLYQDALRETLGRLPDIWLAEVGRLVPDLLIARPDLPQRGPLLESWQRQRLFEALARAILLAPQPLLLFLDDMQWGDQDTLEWLHYFFRFDQRARILLLGTLRSEEIMAEHPVETLFTALRRDGQVTEIALTALDIVETTSLAEQVAGHDLEPSLVASFYQETEGNPLFVVETVRAGALEEAAHSSGDRSTGAPTPLFPPSVQAVIAARLGQLSPTAREVANLAAVIGREFTFSLLLQISHGDEDRLVRGLDELWQRRLVREQGEETYDFSHDKLREGMYAALSTARRRLLHRRVLAALQARGAPSAQLAHHALHAGLKDEAFRYRVAAGDAAMHLFAVRDAITDYEQALLLGQKQLAEPGQQTGERVQALYHLYLQLGRAYELNGDRQQAQRVYEALLTFTRAMHEPTMECAALNHLALLAAWSSDVGTASVLLQEALRAAERSEDRAALAETEWGLAQVSYYAINAQEARLHAEQALMLARACDLKELTARSLNILAYANELLGNWEEVATLATEARTCYVELGNRAMEADSLGLFALARIFSGSPREGIAAARTAGAISREIDNIWGQMYSARQLAFGLRDIGAYEEALSVAQEGVTLARSQGLPALLLLNLFVLGLVEGSMLMLEAAHITLQEAAALNETAQLRSAQEALAAVFCMNNALAGKWTEAYGSALQAQAARDDQTTYGWQFSLCFETEALLRRGDGERAREEVERFYRSGGERDKNRRHRIAYLRALALVVSWHGEINQAIAHLQEVVRLSEEIDLPGERWQVEAALAELYQKCGDEQRAGQALTHATRIVHELASTLQDEHVRTTFLSGALARCALKDQSL